MSRGETDPRQTLIHAKHKLTQMKQKKHKINTYQARAYVKSADFACLACIYVICFQTLFVLF